MKEILDFFKEIFMMSEDNSQVKIGLSQFKETESEEPVKKIIKVQKEVKLSDLMRRSA